MTARLGPREKTLPAGEVARRLCASLCSVIRGKRPVIEHVVAGLLAGGHILVDDVPGLGKTTLAKTIARSIGGAGRATSLSFKRIQFTPDLLPYDVTGVDVFEPASKRFVFSPGPVFCNVLLADEINRTTPKVQSALLEVMAERQVTVGNRTHAVDEPFFVIATQNPVETEGTYALPLAELDRFLMKLSLGYPDYDAELEIVREDPASRIMPTVRPICRKAELIAAQRASGEVHCDERLLAVAVRVSEATRGHAGIEIGASPRGTLMLVQASRGLAVVRGRDFCIDQDLLEIAPAVLAHRLRMRDRRTDAASLVRELVLEELDKLGH